MTQAYHSSSPNETIAIGAEIARAYLHPATVVVLRGDLGAGKTHLIKGMISAFGLDPREITSPTFALANEYDGTQNGAAIRIAHLDCYRFEKPTDLIELGIEDYLNPIGITIIEWPERIEPLLRAGRIEITITAVTEFERTIVLQRP